MEQEKEQTTKQENLVFVLQEDSLGGFAKRINEKLNEGYKLFSTEFPPTPYGGFNMIAVLIKDTGFKLPTLENYEPIDPGFAQFNRPRMIVNAFPEYNNVQLLDAYREAIISKHEEEHNNPAYDDTNEVSPLYQKLGREILNRMRT